MIESNLLSEKTVPIAVVIEIAQAPKLQPGFGIAFGIELYQL
jgi:hypothetical protein